jgi:hypothetical protein
MGVGNYDILPSESLSVHVNYNCNCMMNMYGRRKGQKLAFKTKQTYNVISVNKKKNKKKKKTKK